MDSELLKEWTAEERKEAAEKAAIETSLSMLLRLIDEKFDFVPKRIKDRLQEIKDVEILQSLSTKMVKVSTLEEFEQYMEKILQQ